MRTTTQKGGLGGEKEKERMSSAGFPRGEGVLTMLVRRGKEESYSYFWSR